MLETKEEPKKETIEINAVEKAISASNSTLSVEYMDDEPSKLH